jgi:Xaa-Pro aminopeptidase
MKKERPEVSSERIADLRGILRAQQLDVILAYSNRHESSMAMALAGVPCRSAGNYFFCSEQDFGFIELEYKAEDLRERSGLFIVEIPDENVYRVFLADYCKSFKRVGILGPAPYVHLAGISADIVDVSDFVWPILRKKTEAELTVLSEGYSLLSGIFDEVSAWLEPGITEVDIEKRLRGRLLEVGESLSFTPLVVSGERLRVSTFSSATERIVCAGDYLCIDAGIVYKGLYTDGTRMYRIEKEEDDTLSRLQRAHASVIESLRGGDSCLSLVELYQERLLQVGLPADTLPSVDLGHFIGYMLHEPPFFVTNESAGIILEEGAVFCLEPQITVNGIKMRIEDMVSIRNGQGSVLSARRNLS